MKKFIVLFALFTLTMTFNTTFASVMQEDSLAQKMEVIKEDSPVQKADAIEGDSLAQKADTKRKVTVTKTRQIGPFKSEQKFCRIFRINRNPMNGLLSLLLS